MQSIDVLVVEHDALLRDIVQGVLDRGQFTAITARKGVDAIAALEAPAAKWCALVTATRLGRDPPTGWGVARRARQIDPAMPVIYTTGDRSADWFTKGVPNSILLSTPFAPVQILTAVSQLINERKLPRHRTMSCPWRSAAKAWPQVRRP